MENYGKPRLQKRDAISFDDVQAALKVP